MKGFVITFGEMLRFYKNVIFVRTRIGLDVAITTGVFFDTESWQAKILCHLNRIRSFPQVQNVICCVPIC
jgi:hypothetical protein